MSSAEKVWTPEAEIEPVPNPPQSDGPETPSRQQENSLEQSLNSLSGYLKKMFKKLAKKEATPKQQKPGMAKNFFLINNVNNSILVPEPTSVVQNPFQNLLTGYWKKMSPSDEPTKKNEATQKQWKKLECLANNYFLSSRAAIDSSILMQEPVDAVQEGLHYRDELVTGKG